MSLIYINTIIKSWERFDLTVSHKMGSFPMKLRRLGSTNGVQSATRIDYAILNVNAKLCFIKNTISLKTENIKTIRQYEWCTFRHKDRLCDFESQHPFELLLWLNNIDNRSRLGNTNTVPSATTIAFAIHWKTKLILKERGLQTRQVLRIVDENSKLSIW